MCQPALQSAAADYCRCVLGDPETKIAKGELRTGAGIDEQALGEPRGAVQGVAGLHSCQSNVAVSQPSPP